MNIRNLAIAAFLIGGLQAVQPPFMQSSVYGQTTALTPLPPRPGAAGTGPASSANAPANLPPLYVIQANDMLSIFVWKEPTLSGKVLVRPDGRISIPLVQDMQAADLTPGELKMRIEESLKRYIEVPTVTVVVEAIQSYRIFVNGKVLKPGEIMAERPINVLQALALAGGFAEFAKVNEIVIVRNNNGKNSSLLHFDYREVIRGKNFDQNLMLRNGDVVIVP